jgi:hypothetical protein
MNQVSQLDKTGALKSIRARGLRLKEGSFPNLASFAGRDSLYFSRCEGIVKLPDAMRCQRMGHGTIGLRTTSGCRGRGTRLGEVCLFHLLRFVSTGL